jgi:DtxR family transcriptional regulator, Mn-dependent transcriptional regulator
MQMTPPSEAMQDYLAEAYRIAYYQENDPYVSTSDLAAAMAVTAPAVTRMVQRMRQAGLLEHQPYHGIRLTEAGEQAAIASIRRHRLVERFLVDVMGFGWHEVHDASDAMANFASETLIDRMDTLAGYPQRCPHGEPIPRKDGVMPRVRDAALYEVPIGEDYVVSRVHTHDDELLRYIESLGLTPGVGFRLLDRAPFNGPLHLRVGDSQPFIGIELAKVLRVCAPEDFNLE